MNKLLDEGKYWLDRGRWIVIFPEGTRGRDGKLQRFRRAGSQALLEAADELPVVPVAIDGSWRLLGSNLLPVPFGTNVRIRFGDPIARSPEDATKVSEAAREWIDATLTEFQAPAHR